MIFEKINFYSIISFALIFMGIFSIIYGYIIPTKFNQLNSTIGLGFEIVGILFIIISIILFVLTKKNLIK